MARYILMGDWPATGSLTVPAGTIIDGDDPQWRGIPLPSMMPINAKALDQSAYEALADWYHHSLHRLHYSNDVKPRGKS
jgi:hypothetical protein